MAGSFLVGGNDLIGVPGFQRHRLRLLAQRLERTAIRSCNKGAIERDLGRGEPGRSQDAERSNNNTDQRS